MLNVHLRINDAATGKPTPVRLRVTGPGGTFYPPLGRFADFPTGRNEAVGGHVLVGREAWVYTDGSCEIPLPGGVPLRVRATKGTEFAELDETVTLGPGQMALRFTLSRWSDIRSEGWHPGDTRCHFLSPHDALSEAAAEDLDVLDLLATVQPFPSLDGTAYPTAANLTAFSGQTPALERDGRLVAVNTLNTHPVLGRVGLLHSHRPVFPLTFGGDEATDDWSVCDWCDQCHRKGGLTVWADPFREAAGPVGGEALVALLLGKIDAVEVDPRPRKQPLLPWVYRLWNAGFRVPLVGSGAKDSNRTPLGAVRTYARVEGGFSYKAWVEAVRAGRTFVTDGPLLLLDVEGRGPGETVEAEGSVRVRVEVRSRHPAGTVELVRNGAVVAADPGGLGLSLPVGEACWLAARCRRPDEAGFVHTSAVTVHVAGRPPAPVPAAIPPLRKAVADTREWVEAHGRFANPKARQHLLGLCDEALGRIGGAP